MILDDRALAVLNQPPPPAADMPEHPAAVSFTVQGRMVQWNAVPDLAAGSFVTWFDASSRPEEYVPVTVRWWAADGRLLEQLPTQLVPSRGPRFFVTVQQVPDLAEVA